MNTVTPMNQFARMAVTASARFGNLLSDNSLLYRAPLPTMGSGPLSDSDALWNALPESSDQAVRLSELAAQLGWDGERLQKAFLGMSKMRTGKCIAVQQAQGTASEWPYFKMR